MTVRKRSFDQQVCRMFSVPETMVGLKVIWWRRLVQRLTRRP